MSRKPTEFWLTMQNEPLSTVGAQAREAHKLFCRMACDILAVVSHTAGVERAGKGYGLVLTTLRKSMDSQRAHKAVYVLENYGLRSMHKEEGAAYEQYVRPLVNSAANDTEAYRHGNLISHDCPADSDGSSISGESDVDGTEEVEDVKWYIPTGFQIAEKPAAIDDSCVGKSVFFKWEDHGWQLGKITERITNSTPS